MSRRIPPDPKRPGMDSEDLFRLGQLLSGRVYLACPRCRRDLTLTVEGGGLRMGSSPDLTGVDSSQPGRPRLVFWCTYCMRSAGFVQGDTWTARTADELPEQSRWNHLEFDKNPTSDDFDLE